MKYLVTANSPLKAINIASSAYKSGPFGYASCIRIKLKSNELDRKNDILELLNDSGYEFKASAGSSPFVLTSYNCKEIRNIIDFLLTCGLIDNSDRAALEGAVRFEEKCQISRAINNDDINNAQKEILESKCDEHINALIGVVSNDSEGKILLEILQKGYHSLPEGKPGTTGAYLDFKSWLAKLKKFTESEINEFYESFSYLNKIYSGTGNLEATFTRVGKSLPSLKSQQKFITDMINSKISAHLSNSGPSVSTSSMRSQRSSH